MENGYLVDQCLVNIQRKCGRKIICVYMVIYHLLDIRLLEDVIKINVRRSKRKNLGGWQGGRKESVHFDDVKRQDVIKH